jgi:dolichol kinase
MQLNKFEIKRKILHVLIGSILILLMALGLITPLILFLIIVAGCVLSIVSLKFRMPGLAWLLDNFDREKDRKTFPGRGAITMFIGILLAWKLFERDIAYASMIVLVLGDAVSHLVGSHLGKIKNPLNGFKFIEGNLMGGVAGSIGAMMFVDPWLASLGAFGAMFIEAIQVKMNDSIIDDNIIIPLAAGAIMTLVRTVF